MGEQLAKLFVDPAQVGLEEGGCTGGTGGGFGGMCQLLFLGGVYGFILFKGSNMISDGAEMLELVPSIRGVVGAVVLPVLGAVPDGAIVLFSGMGDNAKKELDVGVGCLAGSTIMLLTLPWALSIYAGRVDLDQDGNGNYKPLPDDNGKRCKLSASKQLDLSKTGVNCQSSVHKTGWCMLITLLPYILIQIAAFGYGCYHKTETCDSEGSFPLIGLIISVVFFLAYLVYQVRESESSRVLDQIAQIREKMLDKGKSNPCRLFQPELEKFSKEPNWSSIIDEDAVNYFDHDDPAEARRADEVVGGESLEEPLTRRLERIKSPELRINVEILQKYRQLFSMLKSQFSKMDKNGDKRCDRDEVQAQLIKWQISPKEFKTIFSAMDTNHDDYVSFKEYCHFWVEYHILLKKKSEEEEEEEGDEDDEHAHLSQGEILKEAGLLLFMGSVVILLFSDPMCGILNELGERTHIPAFYLSFVAAPLASNGAEILAAYNFAKKQSLQSVSVSFNTLLGAACMNNTFCLGIFMAIIAFSPSDKGIKWEYASETIVILLAELVMFYYAMKRTHRLRDAMVVLSLYPLSIGLVALLKGLDLN